MDLSLAMASHGPIGVDEMSEPREWWIKEVWLHKNNRPRGFEADQIHLVEHSAYLEMKSRAERAEQEIEALTHEGRQGELEQANVGLATESVQLQEQLRSKLGLAIDNLKLIVMDDCPFPGQHRARAQMALERINDANKISLSGALRDIGEGYRLQVAVRALEVIEGRGCSDSRTAREALQAIGHENGNGVK